MNEEKPLASPVCYARDADPAYMGLANREELIAFLNEMLEAERAGARVTLESALTAGEDEMADLLRAIHRDEARWCALCLKWIGHLGGTPTDNVGPFYKKAMAIENLEERSQFLNRGQGWVVRKLKEMLPKVGDDALHAELWEMLVSHEANIGKTAALLAGRD